MPIDSNQFDQSAQPNHDRPAHSDGASESVAQMKRDPSIRQTSNARYGVVVWLCSMAAILYLDRICWGQAAPLIRNEFELTNTQMAYLAMAFQIAYGIFEIPTGRWGELIGARRIITRIVIWWSAFTALTGACGSYAGLMLVRFLFGAGEAGAYPNAARVLTRWFPVQERGRVQGWMLAASLIGGALSPTLAAALIDKFGWRWTFVVFGLIGIFWAMGFWWWFRDTPDQHRNVSAKELNYIISGGAITNPTIGDTIAWSKVLTNPGIIILSAIILCSSFNSYFYFTWFPTYLTSAHGISNSQTGLLASLALTGAALGVFCGGQIADWIVRRSDLAVKRRRWFCSTVCWVAAICLLLAVKCQQVHWLAAFTAISLFFVQLSLPSWWSAAIEQSGKQVGPLFGLMNMMGTIGALASQWFVGKMADRQAARGLTGRQQWDPLFEIYFCILIVAGLLWLVYRKHPLEPNEHDH